MRANEPRQRRGAGIADGIITESAARFPADDQPRDRPADQRRAKPATFGQLGDDRVGNEVDRAVDQDEIVGRPAAEPLFERAFDGCDAKLARLGSEGGVDSSAVTRTPIAASTAAE